jgi:hypothetical protein
MTIEQEIAIFMSDELPPASVQMPNSQAAEFITALSAAYPEERFFITTNVLPGYTSIERKQ